MLAILKDAVECLEKYRGAAAGLGRELYEDSLEWIENKDTDWLFSFINICDLLGFDPDYLREFLLRRERKIGKSVKDRVFLLS